MNISSDVESYTYYTLSSEKLYSVSDQNNLIFGKKNIFQRISFFMLNLEFSKYYLRNSPLIAFRSVK